jgi:hypothetical protein
VVYQTKAIGAGGAAVEALPTVRVTIDQVSGLRRWASLFTRPAAILTSVISV